MSDWFARLNLKRRSLAVSLFSLSLCGVSAQAEQVCDGETETTPLSRFVDANVENTFVVDAETGLAWARCVVGQSWDSQNKACTGEPLRLTWQEALKQADSFKPDNRTDWRLPNIKELVSIVERNCVEPAKNLAIFPNAPDDRYWTSTPNTSASLLGEAWAVAFYNGRIDSHKKFSDFYVRMVRYAE